MEKNIKISILCEIYGKMLTDKQYIFLEDYYNNDLSLSEIAENNNITRQAVRDVIKQGENKLFEFEEKMELMKKSIQQEKKIESIITELEQIQKDINNTKTRNSLESLKKQIQNLL